MVITGTSCEKAEARLGGLRPRGGQEGCPEGEDPFPPSVSGLREGLAVDGAQSRHLPRRTSGQEARAHDVNALSLQACEPARPAHPATCCPQETPAPGQRICPVPPRHSSLPLGPPPRGLLVPILMQQLELPPPQPMSLLPSQAQPVPGQKTQRPRHMSSP